MADETKPFRQIEPNTALGRTDPEQLDIRRLRLVLETARLGTWEIDPRTNVGTQDHRAAEIFGLPVDQIQADPAIWQAMIHPDDRVRVGESYERAIQGLAEYDAQFRIVRLDGSVQWVTVAARVDRDEAGHALRVYGIVADITQQCQLVEVLRNRDEQLQALNATLEQRVAERTAVAELRASQLRMLAGQLTQAEQQERRRVAHILHEHFQPLLVGARLNLGVLRAGLVDPDLLESVRQADAALDEAIEASRSLTIELCPPVLYDAGLAQALAWLGRWIQERYGLEVRVQADPIADPQAEDVRIALFVAVRELLVNVARHAGVKHAAVSMNLGDDRRTRISVTDAGAGFDPEQAAGTLSGFGLFGIRERMAMLGGRLEIQSAAGRGTRAMLLGPVPPARRLAPAGIEEASGGGEKIRVLVVDDHAIVRDGLVSLLQGCPDIVVVAQAADGQEAVNLARQVQPDVVIMDVSMPRMNGIEATRGIREQLPHVRVIGLSMHTEADMADKMRQAGAVIYLTKSGPPDDLITAIRASVASPDSPAST